MRLENLSEDAPCIDVLRRALYMYAYRATYASQVHDEKHQYRNTAQADDPPLADVGDG